MSTHKDLDVWKLGMDLVADVYEATRGFPSDERYGIVSQMRRAAVSVPINIAEGAARSTKLQYIQFLYISLGSLVEIETLLEISRRLQYLQDRSIEEKVELIRRKMLNLIKYLKGKSKEE